MITNVCAILCIMKSVQINIITKLRLGAVNAEKKKSLNTLTKLDFNKKMKI